MKKIDFSRQVLPHVVAVAAFLLITIFFYNPVFFDNRVVDQHDITQSLGASKALHDFRDKTGEEGLWAPGMFSGMPAYLVNVEWGYKPLGTLKKIMAFGLPHPINNIFIAFLCYYIMLLAFGVRPYLAIAGAVAFGLSSYMIIGVMAGHNARVGAIAFMPLVIAGIHLVFSGKKVLGFGVTTAAFGLHLHENHLQITYYMLIIVAVYGLVQLISAVKEKQVTSFLKNIGILAGAVVIGVATSFGPIWAVQEYSKYSRGQSEITAPSTGGSTGLSKEYAFAYSNGIAEPLVVLVPEFYGGSSAYSFLQDQDSKTFRALSQMSDNKLANQLAGYTRSYWGPQSNTMPYYGGAITFLLFVIGIVFADKKMIWWLVPVGIIGVVLSWGSNFETFNYFLFDYLPGYNKFRSVTFTIIMLLFAMPLLGLIGFERLLEQGFGKENQKKLLKASGIAAGACLLIIVTAGFLSFMREGDAQLPPILLSALRGDRKSMLMSDAFRSLGFIVIAFALIYGVVRFNINKTIAFLGLALLMVIDLSVVSKRYFTADNYRRARENLFPLTAADQKVLQDKSYYRVYRHGDFMNDAETSYYHNSIGGYHGAKILRYQDLISTCFSPELNEFITDVNKGAPNFENYGTMNMLNVKYIIAGTDQVIQNTAAAGNAWFVRNIVSTKSPLEELQQTCAANPKETAVIDQTKFPVSATGFDSTATISLSQFAPNHMVYTSQSNTDGLAVFSEIYYPVGWHATIDGQPSEILRADYVLRAMKIPAGKHTIDFKFEPKAYTIGNKVTMASTWVLIIVLIGSVGLSIRKEVQ